MASDDVDVPPYANPSALEELNDLDPRQIIWLATVGLDLSKGIYRVSRQRLTIREHLGTGPQNRECCPFETWADLIDRWLEYFGEEERTLVSLSVMQCWPGTVRDRI